MALIRSTQIGAESVFENGFPGAHHKDSAPTHSVDDLRFADSKFYVTSPVRNDADERIKAVGR